MALRGSEFYMQVRNRARLRETSDFAIVVTSPSFPTPTNVNGLYASKDGGAGGKEWKTIGAQVQINSGYYLLRFDHSLANPASNTLLPPRFANYTVNFSNYSGAFDMQFDAAPAYEINFMQDLAGNASDHQIHLRTDRKLWCSAGGSNATGTTVLSPGTTYRINYIRTRDGALYVYLNGTLEMTVANSGSAYVSDQPTFGGSSVKDCNPNCNIQISNLVHWIGNDTPPNLGDPTLTYKTVDGAGTYNDADYVGSSSKYLNVDDYASGNDGDTTYNEIGSTSGAEAQTHALADGTYSDTILGVVFFNISKITNTVFWTYTEGGLRVRDNSTNYDTYADTQTGTYVATCRGYDHCPGGAAWTQTRVNALEMGIWRNQIATDNSGELIPYVPTGDSSTDTDFTGVPNGSPNKYTNVDNYTSPDDTDYVESSTNGHRQAFTRASIGAEDKNITNVSIGVRAKGDVAGYTIKLYVKIGGTRYYETSPVTEHNIGTSFIAYYCNFNTSPATGIAWRKAEIEGMEWGWEITAVPGGASQIKKVSGVAQASIKKVSGVAIASVKKISGVSNV